jgi:hypothetical protein
MPQTQHRHIIEGGRILVTTLATFDHEAGARAFLRGLRRVEVQTRQRMPRDLGTLGPRAGAPYWATLSAKGPVPDGDPERRIPHRG